MVRESSIGYFETRVDWRALKSYNNRGPSKSVNLKVEKVVEIGRFLRLTCFVGESELCTGCIDQC